MSRVTHCLTIGCWMLWAVVSAGAEHRVGGRVVHEHRGVEGATVALIPVPPRHQLALHRLDGRAGPEPVATTRTDGDGWFELVAPEAGMWTVRIEATGFAPAELGLQPLIDATDLAPHQVVPATELEVRVVDAEDRPLAARVASRATAPDAPRRYRRAPVTADLRASALELVTTDDGGVARLALPENQVLTLDVAAPGYLPASLEVDGGKSVRVVLERGPERRLRVVDARGRPVAGVVISRSDAFLTLARTDESGEATVALRTHDPIPLRLDTPDGLQAVLDLEPPAAGTPAPSDREDPVQILQLGEPVTVAGGVIDAETRTPIAGSLVWLPEAPGDFVRADGRGAYAFELLPRKRSSLVAAAPGYVRGHASWTRDAGEVSIALSPAGSISGTVVDADGQPIAGAGVELAVDAGGRRRFDPSLMTAGRTARTSPQGRFRASGLATGVRYELFVHKPGYARAELAAEPLEHFEERSGLRIELHRGWRGVGRVVDGDGVGVAGAEVRLDPAAGGRDTRVIFTAEDSFTSPPELTGPEGRFEISDLAPGRFDLKVSARGFADFTVPGLEIPEGSGDYDLGTAVLSYGLDVSGRVVDSRGQPVAGATVHASDADHFTINHLCTMMLRRPSDVRSDGQGEFVVPDQAEGATLHLCVGKEGFLPHVAESTVPSAAGFQVVLKPASRVTGRVVDADGEPIDEAHVRVLKRFGAPEAAVSGTDGRFELEGVEPGIVTLSASALGYGQAQLAGLEVPPEGVLEDVELVLGPAASLTGTVRDAQGRPVIEAVVKVGAAGARASFGGTTDADGRYRIDDAGIGPRIVTVSHADYTDASKEIATRQGANTLDVVLEAGLEIGGWVRSFEGAPVAGATVSLENNRWSRSGATTEADGSFTLSGVAAGRHVVYVDHADYSSTESEPLEVESSIHGVELVLYPGAILRGKVSGLELPELAQLRITAFNRRDRQAGEIGFEGGYVVRHLAPGEWTVRADVEGTGRQAQGQVTIEAGVPEAYLDVEFGVGHTVTGEVLLGGEPLGGARVGLASSGHAGNTMTRSDGTFRVENLPAGDYQLYVFDFNSGSQHRETLTIDSDREIRIELGSARVSGFVRDREDSSPLVGAMVRAVPVGSEPAAGHAAGLLAARTDSRGFFSLDHLPAGTLEVTASQAGYGPASVQVEAGAAGVRDDVELLLAATEGLTLNVIGPSGRPVNEARIAVLNVSGATVTSGSFTATEGGKVRVPTVPAGSWTLLIASGDSAPSYVEATSPGHAGQFQLQAGGGLRIIVPELADAPSAASFSFLDAGGSPLRLLSGDGTVFFERRYYPAVEPRGLPPGTWTVKVTATDGRVWTGTAVVAPGTVVEVHLFEASGDGDTSTP